MSLGKMEVSPPSKEELLRELIELYAESIKRLAYTYVKNWSAAEDITQEVFIKCYENIEGFRGDSSYKTWLYKITRNKCKDYLKSKWYRSFFPTDFMQERIGNNEFSTEEQALNKLEDIELSQKVLALPTKYREIIILFYYEQLKMKEIEALTHLNVDTIKTRLRRGKKLLQKKMERGEGNE
ncbi:sigma-70 family RNA polymerase sigma factor [Niallia sp.]|uniref:sigma-70 family RNA polymerase sigma factor n=1 Tax=Niallia sp. TaxID=2837523 RepID=UPI00289FCDA1|nr:sigma-70 family RNA polymerase sigma factor [Niallia sp.]